MGMKEELIVDWKHRHITYQDSEMFVVDQFEYDGKEYLYVIDENSVTDENAKDIEVAFLYKVNGNVFANVQDDNLFKELMAEVATKLAIEKIKEILEL